MKCKWMLCVKYALLCAIVMLSVWMTAYADCEGNHDFVTDADNPYESRFLYGTEAGDVWILTENQTCIECYACRTIDLPGTETVKPHDFSYANDLGHGVGEHFHEYSCTNCERTVIRSFACDGPPCMAIETRRLVIENPEQDSSGETEVE